MDPHSPSEPSGQISLVGGGHLDMGRVAWIDLDIPALCTPCKPRHVGFHLAIARKERSNATIHPEPS